MSNPHYVYRKTVTVDQKCIAADAANSRKMATEFVESRTWCREFRESEAMKRAWRTWKETGRYMQVRTGYHEDFDAYLRGVGVETFLRNEGK